MQHGRGRGLFPLYTMYIVERFTFIDFFRGFRHDTQLNLGKRKGSMDNG